MGKKHIKRIIKQEVAASMKAASTKSIQSVVVKSTATAAASALEIQPSNIEDGIFSETLTHFYYTSMYIRIFILLFCFRLYLCFVESIL